MSSLEFTTTVRKASKDSRLGINLTSRSRGPHTVTVVTKDGLLAGSGIAPGHMLTSINDISMGGLTSGEAIAALKDAVGEITLGVTKPAPQISFGYTGVKNNSTAATCKMNASTCESLFSAANVPQDTYQKVYKMVETELLPAALSGWLMHKTFYAEMSQYTGKQMIKGQVGYGRESSHERKTFLITSQLATMQRNVDLVAMRIKDRANLILSKYGILAEYALKQDTLTKYSLTKQEYENEMFHIVGLEFHLIESL